MERTIPTPGTLEVGEPIRRAPCGCGFTQDGNGQWTRRHYVCFHSIDLWQSRRYREHSEHYRRACAALEG